MKKLFLFGVVGVMSLCFSACKDDIDKVKDSINILVSTPQIGTYIHFEFVDAKTGKYVSENNVTLKVSGKDSEKIYSTLGEKKATFNSMMGMVDLIVDPKLGLTNLEDEPLEFLVHATYPGYADYVQRVIIHENKIKTIRVQLVNLTDLPEGVSKVSDNNFVEIKNGKVETGGVANLASGKSTVEVPAGTVMKDASGNVVNGKVKSEILFYDPASEPAVHAFPGGLDIEAVRPDGTTANINFSSAGLFDISLTAGDKAVKTFEGENVKLTTELDPALINPHTQKAIAEGDEIEMWSMDPETMIWKYEKTAKVKKANGKLYLQENISHLSYWNWDWFTNSCALGATIKWEGNAPRSSVLITNAHPMNYYSSQTTTIVDVNDSNYNFLRFQYVPQGFPTTFKFKSYDGNVQFNPASLTIMNLCENKTYTVNVFDDRYYNVEVNATVSSAADGQVKIKPNAFFYIKPVDSYYWSYAQMIDGVLKTSVAIGTEYDLFGYYNTSRGEGKIKVEETGNNKLKVTFTPEIIYNFEDDEDIVGPGQTIVQEADKKKGNVVSLKMDIVVPDDIAKKLGI